MSDGGDRSRAKVALIGFMGAGKSTVVPSLGPRSADVDAVIEEREGRTVQRIFSEDGEDAFRALEERVTLELLHDPAVEAVALGGGAILSSRIRAALHDVQVVWLDVELDHAWERVTAGAGNVRPLARDPERFRQLYEQRRRCTSGSPTWSCPPAARTWSAM